MSAPFGWMNLSRTRKSRPFAKVKAAKTPFDPQGRRIIGLTRKTLDPVWVPQTHSLLLSANGGGKTTKGLVPWLFSLLSSTDRPAILILDSKDAEIASQCVPMLQKLGVPTAVIDDTCVLPNDIHGRVQINPMQSTKWVRPSCS